MAFIISFATRSLSNNALFVFFTVLFLISDIHSQDYYDYETDDESSESRSKFGEACTLRNGHSGICTRLKDCNSVRRAVMQGETPDTICGGSSLGVCCPESKSNPVPQPTVRPKFRLGEIAKQKCAEYTKSLFTLVQPPTLQAQPRVVNSSVCEITSKTVIVGGTVADPKEFPHMVAIGYRDEDDGEEQGDKYRWLCGGTLVSHRFVLTAAHCLFMGSSSPRVVRVGDLNLARDDDDAQPRNYFVETPIQMTNWSKRLYYDDIGLLKLKNSVTFNEYVRPACLPLSQDIPYKNVVATGWGDVYWGQGTGSGALRKVTLNVIQHETCNQTYFDNGIQDGDLPRGILDHSQLCAGAQGKDTCQGDSGGPIVIPSREHNCMYEVVGVTSFGRACGLIPGVYTRVYNYLDKLERIIWDDA